MQCLNEFVFMSHKIFFIQFRFRWKFSGTIAVTDSAKTKWKNSRNVKTNISIQLLLNSRGVDVVIEALWRHPSDGKPTLGFSLVNVVDHDVTRETKVCHLQTWTCLIFGWNVKIYSLARVALSTLSESPAVALLNYKRKWNTFVDFSQTRIFRGFSLFYD
jgi:hypothetical protein